ncbi:LpxT activity modulator PmrR [Salmonella enterica]|nr:LpxT activity modulator PmrR [Salmonella enterica]
MTLSSKGMEECSVLIVSSFIYVWVTTY